MMTMWRGCSTQLNQQRDDGAQEGGVSVGAPHQLHQARHTVSRQQLAGGQQLVAPEGRHLLQKHSSTQRLNSLLQFFKPA